MIRAFKAGASTAEPVIPDTRIIILATGDPGRSYTYLWNLTQQYGGTMESVTDAEAYACMRDLAKSEGMAVEPAAAVAFAGFEKILRQGLIGSDDVVVVNCTGNTFPVEKHVVLEEEMVDVRLGDGQTPAPREGLQAALENLDEKTTNILIVEDNEDDALLIRRLLATRKAYRIHHARDGLAGLELSRRMRPDLIVADLMMPRLDGFGLVEELRRDPRTREIPVVIVSAKDISGEERERLNGHIEAVYQKGSLRSRKFVEQVIQVLEEKND
jgi:threonine synthase